MNDQIPADKVVEIAAAMRAAMRRDEHAYPEAKFLADLSGYIKDLEALLPPRPTLADMTDDERAACLRMQCDTAPNRSVRGFIADIYPGGCRVIERDTWQWLSCSDDMVTPRPDLPRMEWPGDQEPDPAPALAAMIAGMHEEWGVAYRLDHENEKRTTWGWETREDAERSMRLMTDVHVYGIVRRYVTTPEDPDATD